jgi:hypothetical protein
MGGEREEGMGNRGKKKQGGNDLIKRHKNYAYSSLQTTRKTE